MKARFPVTCKCGHRGEDVQFHPLFTSAVDGGGWSTLRVDRFTRERDPVPIAQEAGWALVLLRTGKEKIKYLAPTGVRTPNRLDRSESLYRLQTFQKTI